MAGLLEEASRDVMRGRSIDQLPLLDEEKQDLKRKGQLQIEGNAARGLELREGLEKRFQTSDGQWYRYDRVTETHKLGKPPELKPLKLDDRGKIIDEKAAKQLPTEALKKQINSKPEDGGIKCPSYVPKEARNEAAYNKWIRTRYGRDQKPTQQVQVEEGVPQQRGHAQGNIGMNTIIGAQPAKGERGNLSTKQEHYVVEGDTIESIAKQHGVSVQQIKDKNKGAVKKGIVTPGEQIYIRSVRTNLEDSKTAAGLEAVDMGTTKTGQLGKEINQFKAFEEYVFSFAPQEEKSKVLTTTTDTHSARERGAILHDPDYSPDAESGRFKMDLDRLEAEQTGLKARAQSSVTEFPKEVLKENNPYQRPSNEEKFKADLLAKNPNLLPDTRGLQPNTSSAQTFHDRIKSHLQSKGFQREAARLAGDSAVPWINIGGDFVGVVYDGLAVAANPKDKRAIFELVMSGTQLGASIVGAGLMAFPEPTTSGLGYVIMQAGDEVGKLERLWNMGREGVYGQGLKPKKNTGDILDVKKPGQQGYTESIVGKVKPKI